jgi:2'-5' RNA ligase
VRIDVESRSAPGGRDSLRSFVAVRVPDSWIAGLGALRTQMDRHAAGLRWVPAEGSHVTLAFLGSIARARVPVISGTLGEAAAACAPCVVNTGGIGVFPHPGRATVLWLGIQDPSGGLSRLQQRVSEALSSVGLTPEGRSFHAHVTLGRWRTPPPRTAVDALLTHQLPPELSGSHGAWTVAQMDLMESRLTPKGSIYTVLKTFPLVSTDGI